MIDICLAKLHGLKKLIIVLIKLLLLQVQGLVGRVFANGPGDWVQSQVESYEDLKKWYLIASCLTLSIIRYVSKVKWSNPEKGVAPSPTPRCCSY